jgi:hypothetical protein
LVAAIANGSLASHEISGPASDDSPHVSTSTVTITLTGTRFAGTQIPADCTLVLAYVYGIDIDGDDFSNGGPLTWQQNYGALSANGTTDTYTGIITAAWTTVAQTVTTIYADPLTLVPGVAASMDMAPGYLRIYADTPVAACAPSELPALGTLNATSMELQPIDDPSIFGDPAPPYGTQLQLTISGGWTLPAPPGQLDMGELTAPAGTNFDTASVAIAELSDGSLEGEVQLTLSAPATQFVWALPPGLRQISAAPGTGLTLQLTGCTMAVSYATSAAPAMYLTASFGLESSVLLTTGGLAFTPASVAACGTCSLTFDGTTGDTIYCNIATAQTQISLPDALTLPQLSSGVLSLVASAPDVLGSADSLPNYVVLGDVAAGGTRAFSSSLSFQLLRPTDFANVGVQFLSCGAQQIEGGGMQLLQVVSVGAGLQITLSPLHLAEPTFVVAQGNAAISSPAPLPARIAGESTLVLTLPGGASPVPFTAATLMDWSTASLAVSSVGDSSSTSLELPYRLMISPQGAPGLVNSPAPGDAPAWNSLWHARLGAWQTLADGTLALSERADVSSSALAIRSPDVPTPQPSVFAAYTEPLTGQNRSDLVTQSALGNGFSIDALLLSSLGSSASMHAAFPDGATELTAWRQRCGLGRDNYVYAVQRGFLFPWGHVASRINVSNRVFTGDSANSAPLNAQEFIVVAQGTRSFSPATMLGNSLPLNAPLQQVDLMTVVTPALDAAGTLPGASGNNAYWPTVNGVPVLFHARVYDRDSLSAPLGKTAETDLAAIFLVEDATDADVSAAVAAFNNGSDTGGAAPQVTPPPAARPRDPTVRPAADAGFLNRAQMAGQKLALAPSKALGDTTHSVSTMTMQIADLRPGGQGPWNLAQNAGLFCPSLQSAGISLPAASLLTSAGTTVTSNVAYLQAYLQSASADGSNAVDAYMQLVDENLNPAPLLANFVGDKANGLITPALSLSGLSRQYGLLAGDAASLAEGVLNADTLAQLFPLNAQLLNLIPFSTLLGVVGFDPTQIPNLLIANTPLGAQPNVDSTRTPTVSQPSIDAMPAPTGVQASFDWTPTPTVADGQSPSWLDPTGFVLLTFEGPLDQSFAIHSRIEASLAATPPQATTTATLNSFSLTIFNLVCINFSTFTFTAATGKKPVVQMTLDPTTPFALTGQIDFLQVLLDAIQAFFANGPLIAVDNDAITLSYTFAVPSIPMGMFNLSGIAIGVDVILSLATSPIEFHFNFAGPDNPFDLAVDLLGGGGYFTIDASDLANTAVTLAGQAGASVSLDLGVASGSVSIMMGFTFQTSSALGALQGDGPLLTGFVRADGELSVLDIISIHASFYLGVTYAPEAGILWGEASISVEVSLLFFHKTISITMRKQFPVKLKIPGLAVPQTPGLQFLNRPADTAVSPVPLNEILSAADWTNYASAFAS